MQYRIDYNLSWKKWKDMKMYGPMSRHLRRLIFQTIKKLIFKNVLDVGCGEGSPLLQIINNNFKVKTSGLDISTTAIKFAQSKNPQTMFYILDITQSYLKKKFDLIICSEVLEHLEKDQIALNNIAKMAKKYLVVTTLQGRMRSFEKYIGHKRNYNLRDLKNKIEKAGFVVIKTYQWGYPFYSPLYRNFFEKFSSFSKSFSSGSFSFSQFLLSHLLYYLFFLNSQTRGDQVVILAKKI